MKILILFWLADRQRLATHCIRMTYFSPVVAGDELLAEPAHLSLRGNQFQERPATVRWQISLLSPGWGQRTGERGTQHTGNFERQNYCDFVRKRNPGLNIVSWRV